MSNLTLSTTTLLAGAQIQQVGKDQEPIDLSQPENLQAYFKDLGSFFVAVTEDKEGTVYGHANLESAPVLPYGTVAAS